MSDRASELRRQLEARMAALTTEERARLAASGSALPGSGATDIIPRPAGAPIPLTHAQELLWLLDRSSPDLAAYNVPAVLRLAGRLDLGALQRSLDALIARHDILRTAFVAEDRVPRQQVGPVRPAPLRSVDLRSLPVEAREERAGVEVREATRESIRLDGELLLRATVIRMAEREHIVVLVTHHIAADGWSMGVIERELAALYNGFLSGIPAELPSQPVQFADYAVWERDRLSGSRLAGLTEFWRRELHDAPAHLDMPSDRPRTTVPSFEGARRRRALSSRLSSLLAEGPGRFGASRFMILLAGFHALLARWTEQEDILVAIPMAERRRAELNEVVGYLVNTVPIRARPDASKTFAELVHEVRHACLAADEHADIPFERLMLETASSGAGRSITLQASFATVVGANSAPVRLSGLEPLPMPFEPGWAKFEVGLSIQDRPSGLSAVLEYRTDLYNDSTAGQLLAAYEQLLIGALERPEAPLASLSLLDDAERRRLVVEWNATEAPVPADRLVHELITERVTSQPGAVAVTFGSQQLTYQELDRRSGRIARQLRALGVGPEVRVGVCLEPSLDVVAALLGVLKAGGACLPLDPAYPQGRLGFMLADAAAPVILTTAALAEALPHSTARTVFLDRELEAPPPDAWGPNPQRPSVEATAYVLYTSGSTGQPRGVLLSHRSLVNQHLAVGAIYGFTPADRVPQLASLSFDIALEEIFATLVAGATVVMRPPGTPLVGAGFHAWITEQGATVLELATAHWHEWTNDMAVNGQRVPPSVRLVSIGGEKAEMAVYRRWLGVAGPRVRLLNGYGPTEATVEVTFWEVGGDFQETSEGFPIGRPMANVRAYVLDRWMQPVPIGFPGQLYAGGMGVAKGYLNQPELTAEKFRPDPFHPGTTDRIYATGDRARLLADGNLVYCGRADHQVKLHGFRIELGEIESALAACEGVSAAAAVVREDRPGQRRLVAYWSRLPGAVASTDSIRATLRRQLPVFMLPSRVIELPALVMSPNGKIDRKALPVPEDIGEARSRTPPANELEREIAEVWRDVLGADELGMEDDLFELGGHSLLVMRIASRLGLQTGKPVTLVEILANPTVRRLAVHLAGRDAVIGPDSKRPSLRSIAQRRNEPAPPGPASP